jgi:putative two-component system response regulator
MSAVFENRAVARLSEHIALACGYSPEKAKQIGNAAALHDIGKQAIPKSIIDKPGKLTAREFEIMKTHTKIGAQMLSAMQGELGTMARTVCEFHHEKWNAGGYWGVRAADLPEYVSIVSISDIYVACRSLRPYKPAWTVQKTLDYIRNLAGTQFSHELVNVFIPLAVSGGGIPAVFNGEKSQEGLTDGNV